MIPKQSQNKSRVTIVHLFEKMHSNVTKFRESISSSPSSSRLRNGQAQHECCACLKTSKHRVIEAELYQNQRQLISKVVPLFEAQGSDTLAQLLEFMAEYLTKLAEELNKELMCSCKQQKINQNEELLHKINFLREQNSKFFRMVEEKTQECQTLKKKVEELMLEMAQREVKVDEITPLPMTLRSMATSQASSESSQEMSSRTIPSNSSRVSQFRVGWPELMLPMGEGAHKGYFEPWPGDRQARANYKKCLQDKDLNLRFDKGVRKPRLFCCGDLPNV